MICSDSNRTDCVVCGGAWWHCQSSELYLYRTAELPCETCSAAALIAYTDMR